MNTIEDNIEALVDNMNTIENNTEDLHDNLTLIEALIDNMDAIKGNIKNSYNKINKNLRIENLALIMLLSGFILLSIAGPFTLFGDAYSLIGDTPGFIIDAQVIPGRLSIESWLFVFAGLVLITVGTIIIFFIKVVMKNNKYIFMNIKK